MALFKYFLTMICLFSKYWKYCLSNLCIFWADLRIFGHFYFQSYPQTIHVLILLQVKDYYFLNWPFWYLYDTFTKVFTMVISFQSKELVKVIRSFMTLNVYFLKTNCNFHSIFIQICYYFQDWSKIFSYFYYQFLDTEN